MNENLIHSPLRRRGVRAFSLIEVLVVIALLSLIIIGLVAMFSQTQRAYRLGTTQVDVLEAGRAVTDMMTRDLAQMTPSYQNPANDVVNCYVGLRNYAPLLQTLPGSPAPGRTNLLEEMFFLTRDNQKWYGVGYFVRTNNFGNLGFPGPGMGTLYRFETNYSDAVFKRYPDWFWRDFNAALTNETRANKLMDGVVHFKVRTYDTNSYWINRDMGSSIFTNMPPSPVALYPFGETPLLYFYSNAVPASVEVELGIMEERSVERAQSINNPVARAAFLKEQAGKVHLFRWLVPIRNVDPTAYQ